MWVVQVQKDLVDVSKDYIDEIDALVSLDRAECFALKKKDTQKQLLSRSKIVTLRSLRFRGIEMYKVNFVSAYKKIDIGNDIFEENNNIPFMRHGYKICHKQQTFGRKLQHNVYV